MKIVIDRNIRGAGTTFGRHGDLHPMDGRAIRRADLADADWIALEHLTEATGKPDWECRKLAARFAMGAAALELAPAQLSGGEQQMLAMGRGLMSVPALMMLDEPSLGLAPVLVSTIFEIIKKINQRGTPILLIEQNVFNSLKISDRGYVMENGRITLSGTGLDLLENPHIRKTYLGL